MMMHLIKNWVQYICTAQLWPNYSVENDNEYIENKLKQKWDFEKD